MPAVEWLTRVTIWLSVACWAWVIARRIRGNLTAREAWIWVLGALLFVTHALAAFAAFYEWSQAVALRETARQTQEATGFDSGAGLWFNYAFGVLWLVDAADWLKVGSDRYRRRPAAWRWGVDLFMAFMVFNGTVVFGQGPVVWLGVGLFLGLVFEVVRRRMAPQ